ncbi:hypothetical protein QBC39DRAFT_403537 [Podospora conica]|nr:hypothetical protein QBC39DRAFT_403537 [Schizothecium conicum]
MPRPKRPPPPPNDIALANSKSDAEFLSDYILPSPSHPTPPWTPTFTHPTTHTTYTLTLTSSPPLQSCLSLISLTSRAHYGPLWSPPRKLKEMRTPGLRYILVRPTSDPTHLAGFLSLLPTYEPPPTPVLYIYEIHLRPELRGCGLGARLMRVATGVAERVRGVQKVMLTCFEENEAAMGFYMGGGVGMGVDGTSPSLDGDWEGDALPEGRRLRGGRVVGGEGGRGGRYVILSRSVVRGEGGEGEKEEGAEEKKTGEKKTEGGERMVVKSVEEGKTEESGEWEDVKAEEATEDGTDKENEARSPQRKKRRVVVERVVERVVDG